MKGLEYRGGSIRIHFTLDGKRCRETLHLDPTKPAQLRQAVRLQEEIEAKIRAGVFDYQKTFPNSPRFAKLVSSSSEFRSLADEYLAGLGELARGTQKKYSQAAKFWMTHFGDIDVRRLDYLQLRKFVGSHPWSSPKHRNNLMIVMRAILAIAVEKDLIEENPADRIQNARLQRPEPDPLMPDEVDRVLNWMQGNTHAGIRNYFSTAFFTGMRPEELIALQWKDVDFTMNVINVVRAIHAGEVKPTKTYQSRLVALNAHSRETLISQKQLTGDRGHVFINPVTDRPWVSEKSQREHYWKPALEACGIRQRHAYQTRHTFASISLTGGANPIWLARQMGHATPKMVFERYGKWIDVPGRSTEHAKIESMFSRVADEPSDGSVPEVSQDTPPEAPRC